MEGQVYREAWEKKIHAIKKGDFSSHNLKT
jgi:hypothetical protein